MAGIYIHIPFCKQACHYCNFHFSTSLHYRQDLVHALLEEALLRKEYLQGETVETIYFGGGTPSLLNIEELLIIMEEVQNMFTVSPAAEVTFEANPDDISEDMLKQWKRAGINRLSIGVQSFFNDELQWMNRAHTAEQACNSLKLATEYFENISLDLIYGLPGLTNAKWEQNVQTALALNIPHLSCYALTVEPKTPLDKMIRLQKKENINPDKQSEQFLKLMQWMEEAGYDHYEISNFAKKGWRSQHNSSYWQGKKYLGLGPSAHSYNGKARQWNVSNNRQYIQSIRQGIIPAEKEELTATQQLNEYIMTSLRTMEGISLEVLNTAFGITEPVFLAKAGRFLNLSLLVKENNFLRLTNEGKLLADGIAADLFY